MFENQRNAVFLARNEGFQEKNKKDCRLSGIFTPKAPLLVKTDRISVFSNILQSLFKNRGNDFFDKRSALRKETKIFNAEDGPFWAKRRRFRWFKQALTLTTTQRRETPLQDRSQVGFQDRSP